MVKIKDDSTVDIKKDTPTTISQFATTNNKTTMSNTNIVNYDNTLYNRRRNSLLLSGILLIVILGIFYNQGYSRSVIHGVSNNGHNVRLRGLFTKQRLLDEWESEDDDDSIVAVEDITADPPVAGGTEDDEVLEEEAELATLAKAAVSTEMLDEEGIAALDEDDMQDSGNEDLAQPVEQPVDENEEDEDRFDINEEETTEAATTGELAKEEALSKEEPIDTSIELEQTNPDIGDLPEDEIVSASESTTEYNVQPQEETSTESVSVVDEEDSQSEFDEEIDKDSEEIFDEIEEIDEEIEELEDLEATTNQTTEIESKIEQLEEQEEELVDEAIAQEFGDGIVFDDDFNDNMTVAESLVPLEEEIEEIEEEGNVNMLAEEINEIEEEIEAIESFDDDDEAEAVDKEEYLTDLEEIKEEAQVQLEKEMNATAANTSLPSDLDLDTLTMDWTTLNPPNTEMEMSLGTSINETITEEAALGSTQSQEGETNPLLDNEGDLNVKETESEHLKMDDDEERTPDETIDYEEDTTFATSEAANETQVVPDDDIVEPKEDGGDNNDAPTEPADSPVDDEGSATPVPRPAVATTSSPITSSPTESWKTNPPTLRPTFEYVDNDDKLDPLANQEKEAFDNGEAIPVKDDDDDVKEEDDDAKFPVTGATSSWDEKPFVEDIYRAEDEVKKVGGGLMVAAIILMIFTAYQMSENPDGICASLCRLVITVVGCIIKIMLIPFKYLMGGARPSGGHYMTTPDYRDPYGSRHMELT